MGYDWARRGGGRRAPGFARLSRSVKKKEASGVSQVGVSWLCCGGNVGRKYGVCGMWRENWCDETCDETCLRGARARESRARETEAEKRLEDGRSRGTVALEGATRDWRRECLCDVPVETPKTFLATAPKKSRTNMGTMGCEGNARRGE